jgi:hypothetical protein
MAPPITLDCMAGLLGWPQNIAAAHEQQANKHIATRAIYRDPSS